MILYRPVDGDVRTTPVDYRPRTCFLMTQLGEPVPEEAKLIRKELQEALRKEGLALVDANSLVTGKDFLLKIWEMIVSVPLCMAIVHHEMPTKTQCNIFYEIGLAQALGKETLVIKATDLEVPSDLVRTEYLEWDEDFEKRLSRYLSGFLDQASYYETVAEQLERNPLLAIDYFRRAYLILGAKPLAKKANRVLAQAGLEGRAKNSVEMLLARFALSQR